MFPLRGEQLRVLSRNRRQHPTPSAQHTIQYSANKPSTSGNMVKPAITSVGVYLSWVLAGRCFPDNKLNYPSHNCHWHSIRAYTKITL